MTNFILHSIDGAIDESLRFWRILIHHMGTSRIILQCFRSRYFFTAFVSREIRSFQIFDELLRKLRLYNVNVVLYRTRGIVYELSRILVQRRLHDCSAGIFFVHLIVFHVD
ncbi:hypothetical protein AR158_C797R [Paramecium bursaria Chlorella virus AR158]|uniref:hypothetical protein n=1 Tax=Paramecium bursaria Chlorella virus AR158 TaxID=380598 RepID=UPI00015AA908|nr:hypothetical protein AR158_C797R [Paramecium bursaria Chlorella virus AR158]ABU44342.1 hypothetical protein AR158_C797R [Paramecium bursaria Chlorella virus AR158]